MSSKITWELNTGVLRQTDHLTGTSAHAPLRAQEIRVLDIHRDNQSLRSLMEPKQSFWLRGKNRLRIFTLRLTGGAHRYHCSRRKQKPTSRYQQGAHGWSSEIITQSATR
ncbi:hypothetical protein TNCV_963981 [Trichonephila clavipes]|nr:hypothetical protein TNCV_963981 [Trichonephila clavipes]